MVRYNNSRGHRALRFLAPDGGGSGGSSGTSGQPDGKGGGNGATIVTPFDNLPWEELSEEDRASMEAAKKTFVATLQSEEKLKKDLEKTTADARKFQGEFDKLQAQIKNNQRQNEPDPYNEALTEELKKAGYDDQQASALAPVFAGMFKRIGVIQKQEIGKDLAPMGATVLHHQAQAAFHTAVQNDTAGIFQTPEVQQKVWDFVVERTQAGAETTPEIVANLGAMAWVDHLKAERAAGKEVSLPAPRINSTPPAGGMINTPFTFPGAATVTPTFNLPRDPNAARTTLDTETLNALATTFKAMGGESGIYPKDLKAQILKPRGNR